MHEPLLSAGEWEQIQSLRKRNRTNSGAFRGKIPPTIGTGLFVCAGCGYKLSKACRSKRTKTLYRCRQVKGGGCPQGHLNWIALDDVADHIRRAIKVAAKQLADAETPTEIPDPPELTALKAERDAFRRMNSTRAQRQAAELEEEIAEFERRVAMTSEGRQKQIQQEFARFTDPWTLDADG